MRGYILALALIAGSADARTLIFEGKVTQQQTPGTDPLVKLGDTLTIRFDYDPATQPRAIDAGLTDDPSIFLFGPGFQASMDNGLSWGASDIYDDTGVLLSDEIGGAQNFFAYLVPTNTATRPILRVSQNAFSIEPGGDYYGNRTPTLGFSGIMNLNYAMTHAPEPETWAMMILGFGAVGVSIRQRSSRRAIQSLA